MHRPEPDCSVGVRTQNGQSPAVQLDEADFLAVVYPHPSPKRRSAVHQQLGHLVLLEPRSARVAVFGQVLGLVSTTPAQMTLDESTKVMINQDWVIVMETATRESAKILAGKFSTPDIVYFIIHT